VLNAGSGAPYPEHRRVGRFFYRRTITYIKTKKEQKLMLQAECLECGAEMGVVDDVMQGEILTCTDCGAELEVIALEPLTLDLAPMEMEDWGE
jgi:alpha-aminoadipate carrier protein LysW